VLSREEDLDLPLTEMGHIGTLMDSVGRVLNHLGDLTWATRSARTRGGQDAGFTRREMAK
jgi:hypothetical protein